MLLLNQEVQKQVASIFNALEAPVKILLFTEADRSSCETCADTRRLLEELTALHNHLSLEVYDIHEHAETAAEYQIDKAPGIVLLQNGDAVKDYRLRLFGLPSGYEFGTLIEAILLVSREQHRLSEKTLQAVNQIQTPVHIQVYVTPT